jgi:hypothetical protein
MKPGHMELVLTLLALACSGPACAATAGQEASQAALVAFVRDHIGRQDGALEYRAMTATKLQVGWKDLNGDGRDEAVVYVSGGSQSGSGGCDLLVLEQVGRSFRIRGDISISRLPVSVLQEKSRGWRSLTVLVAGGGISPGYRAVLPFDGAKYPDNPSVKPAHRLTANSAEEIIIGEDIFPFLFGARPSSRPR